MECRSYCGACCIEPSISSSMPGMPEGKPAGVRCIHLQADFSCGIYEQRPGVCRDFQAEKAVCGNNRDEAIAILRKMEGDCTL